MLIETDTCIQLTSLIDKYQILGPKSSPRGKKEIIVIVQVRCKDDSGPSKVSAPMTIVRCFYQT